MTASAHARAAAPDQGVVIPASAWLLAVLALVAIYLVLQENGAVLSSAATYVHEFSHDARHALGAPCH